MRAAAGPLHTAYANANAGVCGRMRRQARYHGTVAPMARRCLCRALLLLHRRWKLGYEQRPKCVLLRRTLRPTATSLGSSKPSQQPTSTALAQVPASVCIIVAGLAPFCCPHALRWRLEWTRPPASASATHCSLQNEPYNICAPNHKYVERLLRACAPARHPIRYALHFACS